VSPISIREPMSIRRTVASSLDKKPLICNVNARKSCGNEEKACREARDTGGRASDGVRAGDGNGDSATAAKPVAGAVGGGGAVKVSVEVWSQRCWIFSMTFNASPHSPAATNPCAIPFIPCTSFITFTPSSTLTISSIRTSDRTISNPRLACFSSIFFSIPFSSPIRLRQRSDSDCRSCKFPRASKNDELRA
jgi:hypothetical protein